MADGPLPIWQTALLTRGCQVDSGGSFFPIELRPAGDRILCTPTVSGALMPFNIVVTVGEPVAITWDNELSRYVVTSGDQAVAA